MKRFIVYGAGLAVVAMVALHLIPTEGDDVVGWRSLVADTVSFTAGKCAALFCFGAGIVWAGRPATWGVTLRRAGLLLVLGILLGRLIWSTEVLTAGA